VKALLVSLSIPFIGLVVSLSIPFTVPLHFSEIRNIPCIGYEEAKARKGSSLAWNIPFTGSARFGASTSRRCIGVPDKQRCAAARTYIREKGLCEREYVTDSLHTGSVCAKGLCVHREYVTDSLHTGTMCAQGLCVRRDYVTDSLPAAYTPFIGVRRDRHGKCLASGPCGEVRL